MEKQGIDWVRISFADHVGFSKNLEHILDLIMRSWREIDQALRPIIGRGGIEALFHRSLEITAETYPWLAVASTELRPVMNLAVLESVLSKQDIAHIGGASDSLLSHFYCLLADLIGFSLTDRLLRPVLDPLLNGMATKDI